MKAISLWQPYASLIAVGAKRYETRSWRTSYRGPIAIRAATSFPAWARDLATTDPFIRYLRQNQAGQFFAWDVVAQLPLGAIVAVAELTGCFSTFLLGNPTSGLSSMEMAFGDFTAGRWGWRLENVRRLREPVPCRGQQGLWTLPPEIEAEVKGS